MDVYHVTLILTIVILLIYITVIKADMKQCRSDLDSANHRAEYWMNSRHIQQVIALKYIRVTQEQNKGIRRLVEKVKKLKKVTT